MYSRKFTKLILLLAVIFGCSLPSTSQVGRRLYLVTGMRTPYEELKVPSSVFAVDEGRHLLVRVTDLVDASQGSNFILADHQRRFVVIGSPNLQPTRVVVLNLDNPASP